MTPSLPSNNLKCSGFICTWCQS